MGKRLRNTSRNLYYGGINRIINIVIPFIMRTLIIKLIGEEYLGLNSLFASILQVLSVAELGIGNAISASMYNALAHEEHNQVCALLKYYRNAYRIIGGVIFAVSVCLLPLLPKLISGTPPKDINIYLLYALYVANTLFSYSFFAYKTTLLSACQRSDINDKIRLVVKLIIGLLQFIDIVFCRNIIGYVFLNVLDTIICNIGSGIVAKKMYPQYKCQGRLEKSKEEKIKKDIIGLLCQKIGNTISVSLDTIVISMFLGLQIVAIYGNYNYIINAIIIFITLIYTSVVASIGDSIALERVDKNYQDFLLLSYMNTWLVGWCSICFICLFQNFMTIWLGERLLFPMKIVIALVANFYFSQVRRVVLTYKDAIGIWYPDRFKPLVGCVVNLVLNIILVQSIGVIGVAISTIVSYLFVEIPWETRILFKEYFRCDSKEYYKTIAIMTLKILIALLLTLGVCAYIEYSVWGVFVRMLLCLIVPNIVMAILCLKDESFKKALRLISRMLYRK